MSRTVCILNVRDEGRNILMSIHSDRDAALLCLAQRCRAWWAEQGHESKLPENDELAVKHYFEFWFPEQGYSVEEVALDPLWVGIWSHEHGLDVAVFPSQEQCLLGLSDCVLREIEEGGIRGEDLIKRILAAYRDGRYEDMLSIYSVETDGWMECHEASGIETQMRPWTAEELDELSRQF